ncbi:MAG: hypothetical protein IPH32_18925 [Bacteroidetes bacterium]|nr:hypothetical protein [Bacteroidota bacterium]
MQAQKWFFQRQSDAAPIVESVTGNIKTIEEFFNNFQSTDSLKQFVECLWPISSAKDREWQQTQVARKDPSIMQLFSWLLETTIW